MVFKKMVVAVGLMIATMSGSMASDFERQVLDRYEIVTVPRAFVPFVGVSGGYGFANRSGVIGVTSGFDYNALRFSANYDYSFRNRFRDSHYFTVDASYLVGITNTIKIGPTIGVGYNWDGYRNRTIGVVGGMVNVALTDNWEWSNRYRYMFGSGRGDHIVTTGLNYRF